MGRDSKIGWTHHTWNFWRGCEHAKLSDGTEHPGCHNCYAERGSARNPKMLGYWGPDGTRVMAATDTRKAPLAWNNKARIDGERQRVFVDSWNDIFEDWQGPILDHYGDIVVVCDCGNRDGWNSSINGKIPENLPCSASCGRTMRMLTMNDMRREMFNIMRQCDWLAFLLLTKRPQNITRLWPTVRELGMSALERAVEPIDISDARLPFNNVWVGTSVSDQRTAEELTAHLLHVKPAVPIRFLSIEPLLGPIDLSSNLAGQGPLSRINGIQWAIIGCESSSAKRVGRLGEFSSEADWWLRGCQPIVEQLLAAGIPVFVKQGPYQGKVVDNMNWFPTGCKYQEYPRVEVPV